MLSLLHLSYVQRWCVAPTLRPQSVAEHSYRVAAISVEICKRLGLSHAVLLQCALHSLTHDMEESLTGDIPGPVKSAKPGYLRDVDEMSLNECIIKVADSIETGTFWVQWGNPDAWTGHPYNCAPKRDIDKINHYATKMDGLVEVAADIWRSITGKDMVY